MQRRERAWNWREGEEYLTPGRTTKRRARCLILRRRSLQQDSAYICPFNYVRLPPTSVPLTCKLSRLSVYFSVYLFTCLLTACQYIHLFTYVCVCVVCLSIYFYLLVESIFNSLQTVLPICLFLHNFWLLSVNIYTYYLCVCLCTLSIFFVLFMSIPLILSIVIP